MSIDGNFFCEGHIMAFSLDEKKTHIQHLFFFKKKKGADTRIYSEARSKPSC